MLNKTFEVVEICCKNEICPCFVLYVFSDAYEFLPVSNKMYESICKGALYENDFVRVLSEESDGIVFEVLKENLQSMQKHKKLTLPQFLENSIFPFLNFCLPNSEKEIRERQGLALYENGVFTGKYKVENNDIPNLYLPLPMKFIAKIQQKTKINLYSNSYNPFFFLIVSSNNLSIKLVFWVETLELYSSLRVNDVVLIEEYKKKQKTRGIEKILCNTFTESVYFDCDEITVKSLTKVNLKNTKKAKNIFYSVKGQVTYMSVLQRMNINNNFLEYFLIKIKDKKIFLFYNSDTNFYNMKEKTIEVTELRKIKRGSFEFYLSTIYTQIEIEAEVKETGKFNINSNKIMENLISNYQSIGFLPDTYKSLDELRNYQEIIRGKETEVEFFFIPTALDINNIETIKNMKVNVSEVKKYFFKGKITLIEEAEIKIDYISNSTIKEQHCYKIILNNKFLCFLFNNFFDTEEYKLGEHRGLEEIKENLLNLEKYYFMDVFRVDEENLLYYLTGYL